MRRRLLAALTVLTFVLSGCRPLVTDATKALSVYATFYPIYALTDAVMAGIPDTALHCLVQPQDGCLRNYQLSDWDISLLASGADAVILGGRGLESFESTLTGWGETGPAVSAVLYNQELYNAGQTHAQSEEDSHLEGANPHLYMSVDGAKRIIEAISGAMMAFDPRYGDQYAKNEAAAMEKLDALSERIQGISVHLSDKKVILMNEALIYVAQDYGLEAAEWIDRESGEAYYGTELEDCLSRLKKSGARVVLIEKQAPASLVRALKDAGYSVAKIDTLSTHREGEGFDTYIDAQMVNAVAIEGAFREAAE